jgi:hypothetical protein
MNPVDFNESPSDNSLVSFLEDTSKHFSSLSNEERWCVLQFYSKMHMLKNKQPFESDDWDYISFGLLIKSLVKSSE